MPLLVETLLIGMVTGDLNVPEIQEIFSLHLSDHKRELTYYVLIAIKHLYKTIDLDNWNSCLYIAWRTIGNWQHFDKVHNSCNYGKLVFHCSSQSLGRLKPLDGLRNEFRLRLDSSSLSWQ